MGFNKTIIIVLLALLTTACSNNRVVSGSEYHFVKNQQNEWFPIENIDPRIFESYPPKKDVKLFSNNVREYVFEKDIQTLNKLLSDNDLKLFCINLKSNKPAVWKWKNNHMLIKCHDEKLFWRKLNYSKIMLKTTNTGNINILNGEKQ